VRGPLLGADRLSGEASFHFDVIEAYQQGGLIDNTNIFVLGKPGNGKSALIKTLIWRSLGVYGSDRFFCVIDVKGEYRDLARQAGFMVLDLRPGGSTRINPLGRPARPGDEADAARTARHRVNMVAALCATQIGAPLTQHQEALLYAAMAEIHHLEQDQLAVGGDVRACLADVARLLQAPTAAMGDAIYAATDTEVRQHALAMAVALDGLLSRSMQGMFDGDTPLDLDARHTRGLVIDLSAINDDPAAVPLVMVAVTGWLRELMRADWGTVRKVQIFDEAWLVMRHHAIVAYLQDTWKLGRTYGFANIAVLHRPSDLVAQTGAGTAASAMAVGLLSDTDTIVSYAQNADELATHGDLLGWSDGEQAAIARLDRGESLWAIGEHHRVMLAHVINDGTEAALCDTDRKLARTDGWPRPG
jgi:type IV secretory pathway VirB4 component